MIGDVLHNLRSGLDNLAYALMLAGPGPVAEEMKSNSEFPIFGDEDRRGQSGQGLAMFTAAERKYSGWDPQAKAIVETLQPYHQMPDFRQHPLWLLHDLDRIDKHRFLHTSAAYSVGAGWVPTQTENLRAFGPGFIQTGSGPVQSGASVLRIGGVHLVDPSKEVHVEVHPHFGIVFSSQTPIVGEKSVMNTMSTVHNYVASNVVGSLSQFL